MARSRNLLTVGALGVGALALIGAGASATFNAATDSSQTVTGGKANVVVYAEGSSCPTAASGCTSITLPALAPVGSTFLTNNPVVWMKNVGNIPVDYANIQLSETHNGDDASVALRNQINVCIQSTDPMKTTAPWHGVEVNGPLMKGVDLAARMDVQNLNTTLQAGDEAPYWVDFYAGKDSTCGHVTSAGSKTAEAWGVPHVNGVRSGDDVSFYQTPASLTDAAQGGVVTPKLTFAVTG
jgi:hypothetical protein